MWVGDVVILRGGVDRGRVSPQTLSHKQRNTHQPRALLIQSAHGKNPLPPREVDGVDDIPPDGLVGGADDAAVCGGGLDGRVSGLVGLRDIQICTYVGMHPSIWNASPRHVHTQNNTPLPRLPVLDVHARRAPIQPLHPLLRTRTRGKHVLFPLHGFAVQRDTVPRLHADAGLGHLCLF